MYPGVPTMVMEGGSPASQVPFTGEGPRPFFPAVCLRSHWDPTMIVKRVLPEAPVAQALDPRPWTKVCMNYVTAGDDAPAPVVAADVVLPTGGQFYPASRYAAAIDNESALRRMDRPLGTCDKDQYYPPESGDMYNSRLLVHRSARTDRKVRELEFPKVLMTAGPYPCRKEIDLQNIGLSDRVFLNATKQDKYKLLGKV